MSEVIQEWILYNKNRYMDKLLYVKSAVKVNDTIVITELTTNIAETKRFKKRKTAWKAASKTDQKVALLERPLIRPSIYDRNGGI